MPDLFQCIKGCAGCFSLFDFKSVAVRRDRFPTKVLSCIAFWQLSLIIKLV